MLVSMREDKEKKMIYGLLGCNISYSLSPCMHNFAFRHFGINAEYKVFDTASSDVSGFLKDLGKGSLSGINITVPYKVIAKDAVLEASGSRIDEFALKLGAINTIKIDSGRLEGFNTDGPGFAESLKDDLGLTPGKLTGEKVLVLGAGGAARAISFYLLGSKFSPATIFIHDIDRDKARSLSLDLAAVYGESFVKEIDEREASLRSMECVLVVNATPLGTKENDPIPFPGGHPCGSAALYDLVYARQTELVKAWKKKGLRSSGGLGMLVSQAVLTFNIWTEAKYELHEIKSVMRSSLPAEMKEQYGWNIS